MLQVRRLSIELMLAPVIEAVDFSLDRGQCCCFIGPSGSGKTTILRAVAGLLEIAGGEVDNRFRRSAFLFQEPRLLPWRTAGENIALVAPSRQCIIPALLEELGLDPHDADKYPHELSGGMRQRIALARALITDPDFLLMDEPFSALDHRLRLRLQALIADRIADGMAVCLVTHDRDEAVFLGDTILRLEGRPATIVNRLPLDTPRSARNSDWIRCQVQSPFFADLDTDL